MLRTVLGAIATLIGAALLLVSVFFSTFCWGRFGTTCRRPRWSARRSWRPGRR
ncbi:MAG TPA: hypothetical protein VEX67_04285 [Solirubrobacteraceae bacterium]|nr:hypothetical protein [Solirubrobacteraceae bacterium]